MYFSGFNATTNTASVYTNTGTALVPAYGTYAAVNVALTGANGARLALDSLTNAWTPTTAGLVEVTPAFRSVDTADPDSIRCPHRQRGLAEL